ncbi:MAG TPA: hypothetical protein VIJ75_13755 [Hanamia sp.]
MKNLLTTTILLTLLTVVSCKRDVAIPQKENGNLIINSSFENNGQQSFQGWTGSGYSFVNDVPTNGGQWALQLEPEWFPGEGYAETFITGYSGTNTFVLTCDTKTINWTGHIILRTKDINGTITNLQNITFNNSSWNTISLTTTVLLQQTDELIVHLSAGGTEVATGQVLFDNVKLQRQ